MPPLDDHIQSSLKRTGKEYRDIHEWIDDPELKYERHDFSKVLENAAMFEEQYGKEGAQEYVNHLVEDLHARFGKYLKQHNENMQACISYFGGEKK